jgi:hypothetical protein
MAAAKAKPKKPKSQQMEGWLILHPNGWVETHYFDAKVWTGKSQKRGSREAWRKTYRPDCRMVRGTLSWEA